MQVDVILTGFKERQILVEEIRDMDGRTLRLLHFRREHPEVTAALSTPSPAAAPAPEEPGIVIISTTPAEPPPGTDLTDQI
jgi:hypothetical protein